MMDDMEADEMLEEYYCEVDKLVEKHLVKKKSFLDEDGVSRKKIPMNVRRLLHKKLKLSKKRFVSNSWLDNHKILEQIEEADVELHKLYDCIIELYCRTVI